MPSKTFHKTLSLRAAQGEVNRADEIYVPVIFHDDEEKGFVWVRVAKTAAKDALDELKEAGLEEIEGVTLSEEDGIQTLYFDGPGSEPDEEEEEGKESEGEEEPIESSAHSNR